LARSFTNASPTEMKLYQEQFKEIAADAKYADATDGAPEDPPLSNWLQARISEA